MGRPEHDEVVSDDDDKQQCWLSKSLRRPSKRTSENWVSSSDREDKEDVLKVR